MADIADLERRVIALEAAQVDNTKTLNWVVGTLGRVAADVSSVAKDVQGVKSELADFRKEMRDTMAGFPATIADVMRDVLKKP